jgi:Fe-S cluster assembly protein SufD
VFNGHVVVHHGAVGTDASQTNKNLLLCGSAEIDTRPRLEIFADDVACTHGATVGRLNDDALFYLRSRGITERLARGLLTYGFARELVDRLDLEPLRTRVNKLTAGRLMIDEDDPLLIPTSAISHQDPIERQQ